MFMPGGLYIQVEFAVEHFVLRPRCTVEGRHIALRGTSLLITFHFSVNKIETLPS
jgi:hypothetical protein